MNQRILKIFLFYIHKNLVKLKAGDKMFEDLKKKVIEIAQRAEKEKLCIPLSGNFSIMDENREFVAITPSSVERKDLDCEDICILNLSGEVVESISGKKPSSEFMLHLLSYKIRSDIFSVVHTHSHFSVVISVIKENVPALVYEATMLNLKKGYIPVANYERPGTLELAKETSKYLNIANSVIMERHGVLAVGENADKAFLNALYTEELSKIYFFCRLVSENKVEGIPVKELFSWKYPDSF